MDSNFILLDLCAELSRSNVIRPGQLQPPSEFRIFRKGENSTRKGVFIFDDEAAKDVQTNSAQWGVEHSIDYQHGMWSPASAPADAAKAAGWFKLAMRDGELWAVDVRWTPAAAQALSNGEWRYMSPAFHHDKKGRITELLNVAITNVPASNKLDPLVALSVVGAHELVIESTQESRRVDKALFTALGLPESASEGDAIAKAAALVMEVSKVQKLAAELNELRAERAREQVAKLASEIDAAIEEGRLAPAQRDTMIKLGESHADVVRALLSAAPKIVKMEREVSQPAAKAEPQTGLTDTDKQVAKLLGLNITDFAKSKVAFLTREAE